MGEADNVATYHEEQKKGLSLGPLKRDKLRVSGDSIFYTLQGEGSMVGTPVLFLRLHECNLKCNFLRKDGGQTICDAWYTWDKSTDQYWTEPVEFGINAIIAEMKWWMEDKNCNNWVVSGGEPLMQRHALEDVMKAILDDNYYTRHFQIETNGTIMPTEWMLHPGNCERIQFNCSPKLQNSSNPLTQRFNKTVLLNLAQVNTWFKFVVSRLEDAHEIESMIQAADLPRDRIMLMPEGVDIDELAIHSQVCNELCKEKGWRFSPRLHIELYGDVRAT
jgi:organic radical activating enzyme